MPGKGGGIAFLLGFLLLPSYHCATHGEVYPRHLPPEHHRRVFRDRLLAFGGVVLMGFLFIGIIACCAGVHRMLHR